MTTNAVNIRPDGTIECSEGWFVKILGDNLIEYSHSAGTCLVNTKYVPHERRRRVYVTESVSPLFPKLFEHLQRVERHLNGPLVLI